MNRNFLLTGVFLALFSGNALAGLSEVVNLGKGRYMIGGTSATTLGNASKLQAKAITAANQHCARVKPGSEAVVQGLDGADGQSGSAGYVSGGGTNGWFGGGGRRAGVQVVFTCELPEP